MFVVSKRNIIIPSSDGKTSHFIAKDYVGEVPEWVAKTSYFKALVKDGKITVSASKKDKDIDKAEETPVKDRARDKKKNDKAEESEADIKEE